MKLPFEALASVNRVLEANGNNAKGMYWKVGTAYWYHIRQETAGIKKLEDVRWCGFPVVVDATMDARSALLFAVACKAAV